MAIPTWSRILDTELDAESPITESLMKRLYKNMFAVLGLDYDQASKPVFQLVPSMLHRGSVNDFLADSTFGSYAYTNDVAVSVTDSQALELGTCFGGRHNLFMFDCNDGTTNILALQMAGIEVDWSVGSPTNVVLTFMVTNRALAGGIDAGSFATNTSGVVGIPVNNSYYALWQYSKGLLNIEVSAKAQVVGNLVYLRFRLWAAGSYEAHVKFALRRTIYIPKG